MSTKKKWSSEEKLAVVLDGLKGRSVGELCREYGISDGLYYKWREEAYHGMKEGLKDKRLKENRDQGYESERNRLLKIIGEQQIIIDLQKKISESF